VVLPDVVVVVASVFNIVSKYDGCVLTPVIVGDSVSISNTIEDGISTPVRVENGISISDTIEDGMAISDIVGDCISIPNMVGDCISTPDMLFVISSTTLNGVYLSRADTKLHPKDKHISNGGNLGAAHIGIFEIVTPALGNRSNIISKETPDWWVTTLGPS